MDNVTGNEIILCESEMDSKEKKAELVEQSFYDVSSSVMAIASATNSIAIAADNIAASFANASVSIAQIDKEIHSMDLQFDAYIADLHQKLSKYEISAPIVKEQLNNLDRKMDRILDAVLLIDTEDEKKLDYKMKLLDTLNNYTDKMASMMVQLL